MRKDGKRITQIFDIESMSKKSELVVQSNAQSRQIVNISYDVFRRKKTVIRKIITVNILFFLPTLNALKWILISYVFHTAKDNNRTDF